MDRVALIGLVLALGSCTSFVAATSSDTDAGSSDDGGQASTPAVNTTAEPASTSGTDEGTGASSPTTDPMTDPTVGPTTGDPTIGTTGTESTSGGGESTGDDSTGPNPSDGSSSGEPPASCGDGMTQGGEDCDDNNADELDGCTSGCGIGPTGIAYGAIVTSEIDGGGSTTGINENIEECPPDQVLVGLRGGLTTDPWIGVVGGVCRPAALTNTDPPEFATGAPATDLPQHGGFDDGGPWSTECGADEVVIAVRGGAGDVIDGLRIRCASLDTVGKAGSYSLERTSVPGFEALQGGAGGGVFGPLTCPPGTVAMGLLTRTNSYLIEVALRCRDLDLAY